MPKTFNLTKFVDDLSAMWEQDPYTKLGWFHGRFFSHKDFMGLCTRVELRIRIDTHTRCIGDYQHRLQGREVMAQTVFKDLDFHRANSPPSTIVADQIQKMFTDIRPTLYEYDPRIGCLPDDKGRILDNPLFDPGGEPPVFQDETCPFCREATPARLIWVGGNLRWAHSLCWSKGLPKSS